MQEPTKEQLSQILDLVDTPEFVAAHDKLDIIAQQDEKIKAFVKAFTVLHLYNPYSLAGNTMTVGIILGLYLAAKMQAEKEACPC